MYRLTRIGETLHQMEGFQFTSALDLNMGYYTITFSPGDIFMISLFHDYGKAIKRMMICGITCAVILVIPNTLFYLKFLTWFYRYMVVHKNTQLANHSLSYYTFLNQVSQYILDVPYIPQKGLYLSL